MATETLQNVETLPPHSIEAEQALLAAIFIDNNVLFDVIRVLRQSAPFYRTAHGLIYESMVSLSERGIEITWTSVAEELSRRGQIEEAGGRDYLQEVTEATPSSAGAAHYAEVVRDKWILRAVIQSTSELRTAAYNPTTETKDLIDRFEAEVFKLGAQRFNADAKSIQMLLTEVQQQIAMFRTLRNENNAVPGLPSGFKDLDRLTTGFKAGELLVLAARPGHGKTSIALNIAEHVALNAHNRTNRKGGRDGGVAFFSLEMTGVELVSRVLCSIAGVSLQTVRHGELSKAAERSLHEAQEVLSQSPFYVDDSFVLTMPEIRAKARRLKDRYNIEMVIVDYLQLVQADTRLDRHEQIAVISRGMKALARELEIPVIALAQLNRSIESRRGEHQRPMLSDLRESGSIEQDADMVMFIQRDRMLDSTKQAEAQRAAATMGEAERETYLDVEPARLIIAKNRNGPIGDVELTFRKSCTRFESAARRAHEHFARA